MRQIQYLVTSQNLSTLYLSDYFVSAYLHSTSSKDFNCKQKSHHKMNRRKCDYWGTQSKQKTCYIIYLLYVVYFLVTPREH